MPFSIAFKCHLVAILGPNFPISGPTWPSKPPQNRSKFIVWNHLNLHVRSRCDIDRFFIDFRTLELSKNIEKLMVFEHFCIFATIALEIDFAPNLGPFWTPKSTQNLSPEGLQRCWKSYRFYNAFLNLQKIIFLANMAPTWPDFAPQDGSKLGPKSVLNRFRSRLRFGSWFWTEFGPILDRFWTDFGPNLDRFFADSKVVFAIDVDVVADVVVNDVTM